MTPYFLYMQTARALIGSEMPKGSTAKQVADEGTRRWGAMSEEEKKVCCFDISLLLKLISDPFNQKWGYKYGINFARYKEKSKAYKEGRPLPDITDDEAKKLYDEQLKSGKAKIEAPMDPGDEQAHEEEDDESSDESESSSSSEEEPEPEPVKAPSPPKSRASKRQKGVSLEKKPSPVKQAPIEEPEPVSSPVAEPVKKSPELEKKKKGVKKKEAPEPKPEPVVAPASSPPK